MKILFFGIAVILFGMAIMFVPVAINTRADLGITTPSSGYAFTWLITSFGEFSPIDRYGQ